MKVLHVISGLTTGGAEMMLAKLAIADKETHQEILCLRNDADSAIARQLADRNIVCHFIGVQQPMQILTKQLEAKKILNSFSPDIIHCWMYHANVMGWLMNILSPGHSLLWNVRHSLHDIAQESKSVRLSITLNKLLSSKPDCILFNSHKSLDQHLDYGFKPRRYQFMPNGFNEIEFSPSARKKSLARDQLGIEQDRLIFGNVARFHPMKGQTKLLSAAKKYTKLYPNALFVFVGNRMDNNNTQLTQLINQYGLKDNVLLLGEMTDLASLTPMFDVGISCSSWGEGFSNAIGEAMACGIPCIATDVGDSAQIVGDYGLVIEPDNKEQLLQALITITELGDLERQTLGQRARQKIVSNYGIQAIANQYRTLYQTLSTQNNGGSAHHERI